jgi:hypothetical protein
MAEIASWTEAQNRSRATRYQSDHNRLSASIATELQTEDDPEWWRCIDALLELLSKGSNDSQGVPPSGKAIHSALRWLCYLKEIYPDAPPTFITREPQGGIIIERVSNSPVDGSELLVEVTIYNNESAEWTLYLNGRILDMQPVGFEPPVVSKTA